MAHEKEEHMTYVLKLLETILDCMAISAQVKGEQDEEGLVHLTVSTETPALLIGYHGKTLSSLQTIVGVIAYKKLGENVRVMIDVDGWRERRNETVTQLALAAATRAKTTDTPQPIYNLSPYERRVVHITLSDDPDVITESFGEGKERYVVVKPAGPEATLGRRQK